MSTKARARVRVTILMPVSDTWGASATVEQVTTQARKSAWDVIARALSGVLGATLESTVVEQITITDSESK
jgi:hypothetical protein